MRTLADSSLKALSQRGLIVHTYPVDSNVPPRKVWKITRAGRAVITLLKEAGIWQEYETLLAETHWEWKIVS